MVSRFMAATKHLHAGSAPGAAWDGPEHKAPRAHRPWPRRRAASAGRVSGPVPARRLGAGRGCSSDVGAAAVKDLKTRHATAAPDALPALTTPGGPRAPRAPPPGGGPAPGWWPRPTLRPQRAGLQCLRHPWSPASSSGSGAALQTWECGATRAVDAVSLGGFITLRSSPAGLLEPRPCSWLATRYSH